MQVKVISMVIYFKLYEYLSKGNIQEFILNPYKYSVSFEHNKNGIQSRD